MKEQAYTLSMYKVKTGREKDFVRVWNKLADAFSALPNPAARAKLIQNTTDRSLFYSLGPWRRSQHIRAMRENPAAGAAFAKLHELCEHMSPGDYKLIPQVEAEGVTSR